VSKELLYKVAYDEAIRALAVQQAAIDNFRARAGLLFSVAAITTSFLGAQALQGAGLNPFSWLALTAFVALAIAFLGILSPKRWEVTTNPQDVIRDCIESGEPAPIEEVHREISMHMNDSYIDNRIGLEKLVVLFQIANVLLVVEVVLWTIALASAS
jgi:hypothetical protein